MNDIKKEQKKSLLLRNISTLLWEVSREESAVSSVYITRVDLSADGGICYVYFGVHVMSPDDTEETVFTRALDRLKLYKPSIRAALAKILTGRYTPNLLFLFDDKREKVERINELLDRAKQEIDSVSAE